ncbi:MAG: DUF389 domain-containing protein, partial [Planctomycetales bacterium]|nr:DUF389 domain-containing protein [Planctomycetales bacterium]
NGENGEDGKMAIGVLLRDAAIRPAVLSWALRFARAYDEPLVVWRVRGGPREAWDKRFIAIGDEPYHGLNALWQALRAGEGADAPSSGPDGLPANDDIFRDVDGLANHAVDDPIVEATLSEVAAEIRQIRHGRPIALLLEEIQKRKIRLLILPRHADTDVQSSAFATERELVRSAPCDVMQLRPSAESTPMHGTILACVGGDNRCGNFLEVGASLAAAETSQLTAIYIQPNISPEARHVGERILTKRISRILGRRAANVETKVCVDDSVFDAIQNESTSYDLVLLGGSHHSAVHRFLFSSLTDRCLRARSGPAVAVVRHALPLASRLQSSVEHALQSHIPQLDRDRRVAFYERVQDSSQWNFDFVTLCGLSTIIASIGLVQDSAAVIIGAMLVAPLMTPLLGLGLSLVQGNRRLARMTCGVVVKGFCLAFALGLAVGAFPGVEITDQMAARGAPGLTDMAVAFISGLVAAYANGRPNLVSALPGVAIAAALVPPIATSAITLVQGNLAISGGALLLFATNIVAIVLAAALALWGVGFRAAHSHGGFSPWTRKALTGLIAAAATIGVFEHLQQDRSQEQLHRIAMEAIADASELQVSSLHVERQRGLRRLKIVLASPEAPDAEQLSRFEQAIFTAAPSVDEIEIDVRRVAQRKP